MAGIHPHVERMMDVIARVFRAKPALEFVFAPRCALVDDVRGSRLQLGDGHGVSSR
jgi:hypothetical protein